MMAPMPSGNYYTQQQMRENIMMYLYMSCYLMAAELFTCFMVPTTLDKSALTWSYNKFSRIASVFCINQANDLQGIHEERRTDYLFPLKVCQYCQLENSKVSPKLLRLERMCKSILNGVDCKKVPIYMLIHYWFVFKQKDLDQIFCMKS